MDTYETLMLHDYGFYKFEKFTNYVSHRGQNLTHLKPIFETRFQYLRYDECSQLITAFMKYYDLRIRNKEYQGILASKITKFILSEFGV